MSLVVGQRMVRADDGMKGIVVSVELPGYEHLKEPRIVYTDRGEKRIAGKREAWTPELPPPRKLRVEEILSVAHAADRMLRAVDRNELHRWWENAPNFVHDQGLFDLVCEYLQKRG